MSSLKGLDKIILKEAEKTINEEFSNRDNILPEILVLFNVDGKHSSQLPIMKTSDTAKYQFLVNSVIDTISEIVKKTGFDLDSWRLISISEAFYKKISNENSEVFEKGEAVVVTYEKYQTRYMKLIPIINGELDFNVSEYQDYMEQEYTSNESGNPDFILNRAIYKSNKK